MKKSVIITGASSGIGHACARYFAEKGWSVTATMREPEKRMTGLEGVAGITLNHMDVTDLASIRAAVDEAKIREGRIDAVVNNAGYAVMGPFEAATREDSRKQFDTNVMGLMDVCREIIPVFREQGAGTIVNVASMGGKIGFPYYSLYNSTKFAVEGFSEVLAYELRQFGIKVRIIEPGIVLSDFYSRSIVYASKQGLTAYDGSFEKVKKANNRFMFMGVKPEAAAKVIYRSAEARGNRLRYHVGLDASMMIVMRKLLPDALFLPLFRSMLGI